MHLIHCVLRAYWENTARWLLFNSKATLCKIFLPNSATFPRHLILTGLGNMCGFWVNVEKRLLWGTEGACLGKDLCPSPFEQHLLLDPMCFHNPTCSDSLNKSPKWFLLVTFVEIPFFFFHQTWKSSSTTKTLFHLYHSVFMFYTAVVHCIPVVN